MYMRVEKLIVFAWQGFAVILDREVFFPFAAFPTADDDDAADAFVQGQGDIGAGNPHL